MDFKEILSNPWVWGIGGGIVLLSILSKSGNTVDTTGLVVASSSSANAQNAAIQNNDILASSSVENNKTQAAIYTAQIVNDANVKISSMATISEMVSNILSSANNTAAINASIKNTANTNAMEINKSYADLSAKIKTANDSVLINGQNINGAVDLAKIDSATRIELGFQNATAAYRIQNLISNEHIQINQDNNNAVVASYPYQLKAINAEINGQTALQTILSNAGISNSNNLVTLGGMQMASNVLTSQANERAMETQSGNNSSASTARSVISGIASIAGAYFTGGASLAAYGASQG